jgi:hypothetical protein
MRESPQFKPIHDSRKLISDSYSYVENQWYTTKVVARLIDSRYGTNYLAELKSFEMLFKASKIGSTILKIPTIMNYVEFSFEVGQVYQDPTGQDGAFMGGFQNGKDIVGINGYKEGVYSALKKEAFKVPDYRAYFAYSVNNDLQLIQGLGMEMGAEKQYEKNWATGYIDAAKMIGSSYFSNCCGDDFYTNKIIGDYGMTVDDNYYPCIEAYWLQSGSIDTYSLNNFNNFYGLMYGLT